MGVNAPPLHQALQLDLLAPPPVPAGPRFLVVHLPAFALERCGFSADEVVVLGARRQNAMRIVGLTPAAAEAGLAVGTPIAEARALVPELRVEPHDPVGEAEDRQALVRAFEPLADRVALLAPDAVVLEISATSALYGGEAAMLERVRARAEHLGHRCRLAVADHPVAALAVARHGAGGVIAPGQGAAALAGLPVEALDPPEALHQALVALGVRTVGAFARLDPGSVAGRFGADGLALHRVARGEPGGGWFDRLPELPLDPVRVRVDDELASVDAVVEALRRGLPRLREQLAARDLLVARVELRLDLAWGEAEQVTVRIARPTRSPEVLERLLRSRLERVALGAPVCGLRLHAVETVPDGAGQQDLLERREGSGAWSELLVRLTDVLGDDAVVEAVLVPSWCPEDTWVARPVHAPAPEPAVDACDDDPVARQEGAAWTAPRPRPTLLRRPPLPLRVREEGGRPLAVHGRRGWRQVQRRRGPERLSGQWWRPDGGYDRTYWVVDLPEGTAWLFQERGQWFLQGWYD